MLDAFLYLSRCSFRNRLRLRFRRLRQPRYLLGSIVGLIYLYMMVFRHVSRGGPGLLGVLSRVAGPAEFVGSMILFAIAGAAWALPGAGRPVEFTRAEVQFLFQAPVTRQQLLNYKLLRAQLGALFGSVVATVFLRPGSFAAGWTFLVGLWVLFATVRLHLTGVALRRQSLTQHGRSGVSRQWVPVAVVLLAVLVFAFAVAGDWPVLSGTLSSRKAFDELRRLSETGVASLVLWPFRLIARLPLARSPEDFWRALPAALGLLSLNYFWVLRSDVAFEEASADYAEKRANARTSRLPVRPAAKATAPPFVLSLTGRPEIAILWKNLIQLGRYASPRTLLRFLPLIGVLAFALSRNRGSGLASLVATTSLMLAGLTVLVGPQTMRNDLRQDLAALAVLKSWPVRGAAIVRGELLAPAAVLTAVTWMLILTGAMFIGVRGHRGYYPPPFIPTEALPYELAAAVVAPVLILAQLVLQNGMAILFPAWVTVGVSRARGIDAMGQRLLMMAGIVVALVFAVLPAAIAAGVVGLVIYAATHTVPVVPLTLVLATVLVAECWAASELLGKVLDRTDVGAVEPVD